ncbi:unnamed protein product [Trypanosoma congolense IL3000]|uniref:WGS project CAEQ00000000 data, annotated contig 232 n=1 Tax=Trypanosoma congolense (strain IL3000) TaxID=1068625 RepID=F9WD54_TRYCI|nr:unnamed protein product [Trypanosoma congolense IL3000]
MVTCDVTLVSSDQTHVTIPSAAAWQHIELLRCLVALDEGGCEEMPPIELGFASEVVQAIAAYLQQTNRIAVDVPKPLTVPLEQLVPAWEMEFVRNAERCELLLPLFECTCYLRITGLRNLLAAYVAQRVDEIAKEAPSIMEGAAKVRAYLQLENEWTAEEMEHLEEEMRYAKQVDPMAY